MRMPRSKQNGTAVWERTISRYLTANGIPITWKGGAFTGIAGFTFRRIVPKAAGINPSTATWSKMPEYWRERRNINNLIVIVTNRQYGDNIEDNLVVMRLGTFAHIFAALIDSDRERYTHAPDNHG